MVIKCNDRAISLVPNNSPRRPQFLGGQGQGYFLRYLHQRKREDLQQAIQSSSLAVSSTPDNSPDKVSRLSDLSVLLECRLSVFENDADTAAQRMSCLKQMAKSRRGDPEKRMNAAMKWAGLCAASDPPSSLEAFQCYMSLIPEMAWLGMTAKDRYKRVSRMADTILDPPSLAVAFGQREAALEWLEQGRSIVWNQLLRLRTPTELPDTDASLASELMNVAYELQKTASLRPLIHHTADQEHLLEQSAQHHRCLTERWESLVRQAKSLPGLNEQLGPKKASTLVQSARAGAVVVVMASMIGVIALVIPQGGQNISDLLLGNSLLYDQLANAHKQLNLKRHNRARMERKFTTASKPETAGHYDMLGMLWNDIAWPVLDFLGYTEALPADQLPRITWCTTGPLSFLPLHAAGDYTKPKCSLFDFAVSSYTPTLSALLEQPHIPADFSGVTLVGQEITAGFPRLPGTTDELNRISRQTQQTPITRLEGGEATCSAVLDAMQKHSWVHLACHASQNLADPISSAFHLHDGPLDLAAITDKHLKHADLAFLSACQTATGDKELSEEAVHLAAGMLMAGYRTVIATMWPIRDQDAPLVAERFYEYMLKDGVPDSRKAARALHYAVGCLREKVGVDAYMHWAPYIHMGN
ncbi:hypothetical protein FRC07_001259 [Ceratobasidium sp. 392]|nr:hypothetical protein FRC07_001259 [Ceratobasidium sp. 392]